MKDSKYIDLIKKIIAEHPRCYAHVLQSKKFNFLIEFIDKKVPFLDDPFYTLNTKLYFVLNSLDDFPICLNDNCANRVKHRNVSTCTHSYPLYCSRHCATSDCRTQAKISQTNLQKYGVKCTFQTQKSRDSIHSAIIKKYGGTTGNIWETEYGKQRCRQSKLKKNNGQFENDKTREKRKQTIINRYGGKTGNIWETEHGVRSIKNTNLKRYGYENFNQMPESKERISKMMLSPEIQLKINDTKRRNHTFNTSKPEEDSYALLCELFGADNVLRQYKSEKYPFNCDFYVRSDDIYIECNYSWTHGGHWFDENNNDDTLQLEVWKSKKTAFYDQAINTWTIRDLNKRKYAVDNKLNYVVFWKFTELEQWAKNFKTE